MNSSSTASASMGPNHNHHVPNPPPRTHSRPNQPPPPPPLPTVPPVPPTRDSSIAISKVAIGNNGRHTPAVKSIPQPPFSQTESSNDTNSHVISATELSHASQLSSNSNGSQRTQSLAVADFASQFTALFKPIKELPSPEPFTNKPKTYPSQRALQKHTIAPKT